MSGEPLPRRGALLALALAGIGPAAAQSVRTGAGEAETVREVLALRERVRQAVIAKDRGKLEALYADRFMHLRDTGRADLKGERIDLLLSGASTIETAPEDGVSVQVLSASTALATGRSAIKDPDQNRPAPFRWLTVYIREGEGWRIGVSQASRIRRRA